MYAEADDHAVADLHAGDAAADLDDRACRAVAQFAGEAMRVRGVAAGRDVHVAGDVGALGAGADRGVCHVNQHVEFARLSGRHIDQLCRVRRGENDLFVAHAFSSFSPWLSSWFRTDVLDAPSPFSLCHYYSPRGAEVSRRRAQFYCHFCAKNHFLFLKIRIKMHCRRSFERAIGGYPRGARQNRCKKLNSRAREK